MSLKISLSRGGAKKRPFYRIVVADSRSPRDGRFIETSRHFRSVEAEGRRRPPRARRREGQGLDRQGRDRRPIASRACSRASASASAKSATIRRRPSRRRRRRSAPPLRPPLKRPPSDDQRASRLEQGAGACSAGAFRRAAWRARRNPPAEFHRRPSVDRGLRAAVRQERRARISC